MSNSFYLLDLPSQALAVQRVLSGYPEWRKLDWLGTRGGLTRLNTGLPAGSRPVYHFESCLGLWCAFFFDGDEFVFIGDHTTYKVTR